MTLLLGFVSLSSLSMAMASRPWPSLAFSMLKVEDDAINKEYLGHYISSESITLDYALLYGSSIKSTIERYKKACSDSANTSSITEINAQYYQQESAKLRQQIQMLQNSNRHLMGDSLSSLTVKELKQLENRLERGITRIRSKKHEMLLAEIEFFRKREIELENESVCIRTKIAEVERLQQANMVTGADLNAIHELASRNFFSPEMIEGGNSSSHPDKKILHIG